MPLPSTLSSPSAQPALLGLAAVGGLYLSLKVLSFFRLLASLFLLPGDSLYKFGPKGSWAVITGASDGIGKEYALQIAAKGFNVVLVSRTASKLEALATEIRAKTGVQVLTHAMDFSSPDTAPYDKLAQLTAPLDISLLINNVGQSHSYPEYFINTPKSEIDDIITINCLGTVRVTRMIAPLMAARKRGLILTMASFGGVLPTPLLATYSGSKAFLQHWAVALGAELAPHGVSVQVVQSHLVASAMSKIRRASAMVPTPKTFVRSALGKIGRSGGSQGVPFTVTPYWAHALLLWGIQLLGVWSGFVLQRNLVMHETIRKRALKKAERDAKKQ
ncbi:beta-hydroxysteroid dehydrogenase [Trichodelitschia bisporula]|uniref:Very-long-chain 3-oxoacyl-CoA reductase n=1 Tax=Trichodelitschia bisporula TaxID=703511 RepID=A0A6G1I5N7_9PEZI|nr:beta-hydroxysteroid dehydrogenase [Trichodelitschia bisporula]